MRHVFLLLLAAAVAGPPAALAPVALQGQTFTQRVALGLQRPVAAAAPPGDVQRLFIAEQHTGRIRILDLASGTLLAAPFLDLDGLATGNEQGLLGLTFDPNYASNGYFYVNVTTQADGGDTHVRRYQAIGDPATAVTANPASALELLSFNQPQGNHNGGWIDFSPVDGYLYIASGDGGNGNDEGSGHTPGIGNAQDLTNNLLGKMLRIDVQGDDFPNDAQRNYAIPPTNPFVGDSGDDEIWSYGLRNPFRASFDRVTGDLWIGDVGQSRREEINFQPASSTGGENYGWRLREGIIATPGSVGGPAPPGHVEPMYDYDHLAAFEPDPDFRGSVVIGGYVYRGPVAAFQGHYFFADAGSQNIWKLDPDAVDPRASVTRVNPRLVANAGSVGSLSSFAEDAAGNLYLLELGSGEVFRVATASQDAHWNGADATAGAPGDGVSWSDPANWTRGGAPDQPVAAEDRVIFGATTAAGPIQLQSDRTVAAVEFAAPHALEGATLRVLSGNIVVEELVTATIRSTLAAETEHHALRKLGAGTLLVEGVAGQLAVKAGRLGGTGVVDAVRVARGAELTPGSGLGTLAIGDRLAFDEGSLLTMELGGTVSGAFDQLTVAGTALLGGTLSIQLVNDGAGLFQPQPGDQFPLLTAASFSGAFDVLDLPPLPPQQAWRLGLADGTLVLRVDALAAADFNQDGLVDAADLTMWETAWGNQTSTAGDANLDGTTDGRDLLIWQRQAYGAAAGAPQTTAIPEPNLAALAVLGAATAACRRRRQTR
jgi:glucose/arabinose dehydrogenase